MSASCFLQPPRNSSTGQVPVLEHETFSRTLLNFLKDCPSNTSYMHEVFLGQSWAGAQRFAQEGGFYHPLFEMTLNM